MLNMLTLEIVLVLGWNIWATGLLHVPYSSSSAKDEHGHKTASSHNRRKKIIRTVLPTVKGKRVPKNRK